MAKPIALLDVDGTLVDTNYHHAIAWYRAFGEHGLTLPVWRIHRHIGRGGDQLVAAVAGKRVEDRQGDSIRAAETALYAPGLRGRRPGQVPALAVLTGGFSEQELGEAGAMAVFESLTDLCERLDDTPLA